MPNKRNWFNTPVTAILVNLILLAVLVISVAGAIFIIKGVSGTLKPFERDSVTITGEGRVQAQPDIGQVTVTIITEADEAIDAQEENIEQFNSVVEALKAEGVSEEDLQTVNYSVNPRYRYFEGERTQEGFEVRQSLEVKIRDLDKSGAIVRAAGQNGVNQVSGLSFTVDDPEVYREEARKKALENAQKKAEDLAAVTGVKLGKVISFSESSGDYYPPTPVFREMAMDSVGFGGAIEEALPTPDFEPGSEEITAFATIVYEVK